MSAETKKSDKDLSDDQRAYVEAISQVIKKHVDVRNADLTARLDALEMEFKLFDKEAISMDLVRMLGAETREIMAEKTKRIDAMERKIALIPSVAATAKSEAGAGDQEIFP